MKTGCRIITTGQALSVWESDVQSQKQKGKTRNQKLMKQPCYPHVTTTRVVGFVSRRHPTIPKNLNLRT